MQRVTSPDGVLRHAIYTASFGDGPLAEQGSFHVLTPRTRFRRRDGEIQSVLEGFEAFDGWGRHRLVTFEEVGIGDDGAGRHLIFERPATIAEREMTEAEARFHAPEHLLETSRLLADDFLKAAGSVVEAVGLYGALARGDTWPGDEDLILFVSEERALAFLEVMQTRQTGRRRRIGDGRCLTSVLVQQAEIPEYLATFLHLPAETLESIEWRLRGNITKEEIETAEQAGNTKARFRWKKLDLQVLPLHIGDTFREAYDRIARDPDFLRRIRPDIRVFDPRTSSYTQERAQALVSWEI